MSSIRTHHDNINRRIEKQEATTQEDEKHNAAEIWHVLPEIVIF